ncbi:MAG TPA: DNA-processing protein DprA [Polyangiaceae bacterium]|nr:DNA-processing protein DprA [Polyangiaceae bacterium]
MFEELRARPLAPTQVLQASGRLACLGLVRSVPHDVFVWGVLPPRPWVSIVGTRRPSVAGEQAAFQLAQKLAEVGVCVLSGGAMGIDAAAHRGALAGGGKTVVVAPTWLERAYPAQHRDLFEQVIQAGGAYLTTASPEQQAFNAAFFVRNEVLTALSDVVILGDCPVRSGARNAMSHARRMGKPRYCLPVPFGAPQSLGNWSEVRELGAVPIVHEEPVIAQLLLLDAEDLSAQFLDFKRYRLSQDLERPNRRRTRKMDPPQAKLPFALPKPAPALGVDAQAVADAIQRGCTTPDEIAVQVAYSVAEVQHQILLLTLQGIVAEDERGVLRYQAPGHD